MIEDIVTLQNDRNTRSQKAEEKFNDRISDLYKRIETKLEAKEFNSFK